jgi:hypothetical protein
MYTTQGILICNANLGTTKKNDKEKIQSSFWNRIEQFNENVQENINEEPVKEPVTEPVTEPVKEPVKEPKQINIVY